MSVNSKMQFVLDSLEEGLGGLGSRIVVERIQYRPAIAAIEAFHITVSYDFSKLRSSKRAFRERYFELVKHRSEGWFEYLISSLGILFRDVAFCPGNGASHAGDCVRIAAD